MSNIITHNGKTISATNRIPVDIGGATIDATISGVTIQDPTTPANKQKVNSDGTTNVVLTGSNVSQDYLKGQTIAAGGNAYAFSSNPVSATSLRVSLKVTSSSDFMIQIRHLSDTGDIIAIEDFPYEYVNYATLLVAAKGKMVGVRIYNQGAAAMTITTCNISEDHTADLSGLEKPYIKKPKMALDLPLQAGVMAIPFVNVNEERAEFITVGIRGNPTQISKTKVGIRWKFFGTRTSSETLESDIEWLIADVEVGSSAPIGQTRMKSRKFDIVVLCDLNGTLPFVGYSVQGVMV